MIFQILLDLAVEQCVVYVDEKDDRMRQCHAAPPARPVRPQLKSVPAYLERFLSICALHAVDTIRARQCEARSLLALPPPAHIRPCVPERARRPRRSWHRPQAHPPNKYRCPARERATGGNRRAHEVQIARPAASSADGKLARQTRLGTCRRHGFGDWSATVFAMDRPC